MQVSVLPVLLALPLFPLSFRMNATGVASVVQVPVSVEVNEKFWSIPRGAVFLMIVTVPQFVSENAPGPTRSFICAVPELPELRLAPVTDPNASHDTGEKTPAAVRSRPASPNSRSPTDSGVGAMPSNVVSPTNTAASA